MPKKNKLVDLWTERDGRLTDYILIKKYNGIKGNNFFSPTRGGISVVRYDGSEHYCNATHWMYVPEKPKY